MRLSVTTPRGALVDTDVEEVTAPGELGEFGVLPGHVPLMSALKPGVLWYKGKDRSGVAGGRAGVPAGRAAAAGRRPRGRTRPRAGAGRSGGDGQGRRSRHAPRRISPPPSASWPPGRASSTAATRPWSSAAAGPRPASTPPPASRPTDRSGSGPLAPRSGERVRERGPVRVEYARCARQIPLLRHLRPRHRGRAAPRDRGDAHRRREGRPGRRLVRGPADDGDGGLPARARRRARADAARRRSTRPTGRRCTRARAPSPGATG